MIVNKRKGEKNQKNSQNKPFLWINFTQSYLTTPILGI